MDRNDLLTPALLMRMSRCECLNFFMPVLTDSRLEKSHSMNVRVVFGAIGLSSAISDSACLVLRPVK